MKREIEVELRYGILGDSSIDLKFFKKKRVIDIYFDTKTGSFFKKGIFIRRRDNRRLDFKFNLESIKGSDFKNDHSHCDEYTFKIPFQNSDKAKFREVCTLLKIKIPKKFVFENFLDINSFIPLVIIDKIRKETERDGFHICIDNVKNIGVFIEVEKTIELEENEKDYEKKLDKIKESINQFVYSLGISVKRNEIGYCELALREINFDLYRQGKYVLEEDKN